MFFYAICVLLASFSFYHLNSLNHLKPTVSVLYFQIVFLAEIIVWLIIRPHRGHQFGGDGESGSAI